MPLDPDLVVVVSGIVELTLGAALLVTWKPRTRAMVGVVVAAFFVVIFPGNIGQLTGRVDAFGLDTDAKRAVRLLFQPVLVLWALWATGGLALLRSRPWRSRRDQEPERPAGENQVRAAATR
jgi:uncharacterized membrane protein